MKTWKTSWTAFLEDYKVGVMKYLLVLVVFVSCGEVPNSSDYVKSKLDYLENKIESNTQILEGHIISHSHPKLMIVKKCYKGETYVSSYNEVYEATGNKCIVVKNEEVVK